MTFKELTSKTTELKQKKEVLQYLVEHLDESFFSVSGARPLKTMLSNDKLPIPETIFESIITDILVVNIASLTTELSAVDALVLELPTQNSTNPQEESNDNRPAGSETAASSSTSFK